jgi:hypothetical protein
VLLQTRKKLRKNQANLINKKIQPAWTNKRKLANKRKRSGRGGISAGKKSLITRRRGVKSNSRDVRST